MKHLLPLILLLSACNSGEGQAPKDAPQPPATAAGPSAATGALTGLYAGAAGEQTNQLCMIGRGETDAAFGLVVWGGNMHSCSGTGTAKLEGDRLRLSMAGDSECAIDATMADGTITLPATVPEGCSYYCGARARLAGTSFAKQAATREAALEAKDLVGDSLCEGL